MLYRIYTGAIVLAWYPFYLSILAVDKLKEKLGLD